MRDVTINKITSGYTEVQREDTEGHRVKETRSLWISVTSQWISV